MLFHIKKTLIRIFWKKICKKWLNTFAQNLFYIFFIPSPHLLFSPRSPPFLHSFTVLSSPTGGLALPSSLLAHHGSAQSEGAQRPQPVQDWHSVSTVPLPHPLGTVSLIIPYPISDWAVDGASSSCSTREASEESTKWPIWFVSHRPTYPTPNNLPYSRNDPDSSRRSRLRASTWTAAARSS